MKLDEYFELSKEQLIQFETYTDLLLEWNEKINLTAIIDRNEIILKHFIDSLSIIKYLNDDDNVIDIGTGAGFPGIPIKIYYDKLNLTLVDSLNKRILFLDDVISKLEFKNIKTIHSRAEELARKKEHREKYTVAVSRAVANLSTLLEYLMPYVKLGGKCICMKGPNIRQELNSAKNALKELGGELEKVDNFKLPSSDIERNLVIIRKVRNTSEKYPRKAGIPSKNPL